MYAAMSPSIGSLPQMKALPANSRSARERKESGATVNSPIQMPTADAQGERRARSIDFLTAA